MNTFKTWLPVFPGFYGTNFESNEDSELDYINQQREEAELVGKVTWDHCDWDNETYHTEVSKKCVGVIESLLQEHGLVSKILFENLSSPREYNFHNDSINIAVEMDVEHITALQKFMSDNWGRFSDHIRSTYTSRSGFNSHYSAFAQDWAEDTENFSDFNDNGHRLGAVLEFVCRHLIEEEEGNAHAEWWLYESIVDYPNVQALNYKELTENNLCPDCNEFKESYDWCDELSKCSDCASDGQDDYPTAVLSRRLMNEGYEFTSSYEEVYKLNHSANNGSVLTYKGYWIRGEKAYGVRVTTPNLDVYGVLINN